VLSGVGAEGFEDGEFVASAEVVEHRVDCRCVWCVFLAGCLAARIREVCLIAGAGRFVSEEV
jgi:hypothetical protein